MIRPVVKGFIVKQTRAWWITCPKCEDTELIFGSTPQEDATAWAAEHAQECPK